MKLENQVLNIDQIRELIELGFDVNKYASVEVNVTEKGNKFIISKEFIKLFPKFGDDNVIERYSTMTIGDIISVLPPHIYPSIYHKKYGEEIEQTHILIMYLYGDFGCLIRYKHHLKDTFVFESREKSYIKALFETLKWGIKEKHIAL